MKSLEAVIAEALEESRAIPAALELDPIAIEVALRVREWLSAHDGDQILKAVMR